MSCGWGGVCRYWGMTGDTGFRTNQTICADFVRAWLESAAPQWTAGGFAGSFGCDGPAGTRVSDTAELWDLEIWVPMDSVAAGTTVVCPTCSRPKSGVPFHQGMKFCFRDGLANIIVHPSVDAGVPITSQSLCCQRDDGNAFV